MTNNVYKKQSTLQMYYTMRYAPFLKNGATCCLTEPYYQASLRILIPYVQAHMNALDLGCALGRMSFELAKQTLGKVVGIDTSQEFITACQQIAANQNQYVAYPAHRSRMFRFTLLMPKIFPSQNIHFSVCCV